MKYLEILLLFLGILLIVSGTSLITYPGEERIRLILIDDSVEFSSENVTVIYFRSGLNLTKTYDVLISIKLIPYFIPPNSTGTPILSFMVVDEVGFEKIKEGGLPEYSYLALKAVYENRTFIIKGQEGERKLYLLLSSPLPVMQKANIEIYERFQEENIYNVITGKIMTSTGIVLAVAVLLLRLKKTTSYKKKSKKQ
ncbi:MAG: hypothetical protein QXP57_07230 [Nitrososphaerota archaeon]